MIPDVQPGQSLGRYLALEQVGSGGQGVVIAAYDPQLDRKVALKLLQGVGSLKVSASEARLRLLREAQAMARLSHPNVIAVHDVGTFGEQVFLAMELVDGVTLHDWVASRKRSWREILDLYLQTGQGLAAAHAAGLVHRDFKPENVVVGKDGRARVTDFGLARLQDAAAETLAPHEWPTDQVPAATDGFPSGVLGVQLTGAGVVKGTPAYMAPEQFRGAAADARSDQFSFCAALYFALYGQWAYDPDSLRVAAFLERSPDGPTQTGPTETAVPFTQAGGQTGEDGPKPGLEPALREPPRAGGVPRGVRRAVMRGLSLDPAKRHPSMDALLGELARSAARARRLWVAASAALVVAAVASLGTLKLSQARALCSGGEAMMAGVWDAPVAGKMERAFTASRLPYAPYAARAVRLVLDDYARRWVDLHREACAATRLRGEQSEALMQRRMVCLEQRRRDLAALTRVLADADAKAMEKAVDAAQALPSLAPCSGADALSARPPPPEDPAARQRIDALGERLSELKALTASGKFRPALAGAQELAPEAERTGYAPLIAEALYQLGWSQSLTGDARSAEATLLRASGFAEEARDDFLRAQIGTKLAYVMGTQLLRGELALEWTDLTASVVRRAGGDAELESSLESARGSVALAQKDLPLARASFERALALIAPAGPDHPQRAVLLASLGRTHALQDDARGAVALLEESLRVTERTTGPGHPNLAYPHYDMGQLYTELREFDRARAHAEQAREIWEASLGPDHPLVASALENLGTAYQQWGRSGEALAAFHRALEIRQRAQGADHVQLVYSLDGIGQTLLLSGKAAEAIPFLERALPLWRDDLPAQGETGFALARAIWAGKHDAAWARGLAEAARDAYARSGHAQQAKQIETWLTTLRR